MVADEPRRRRRIARPRDLCRYEQGTQGQKNGEPGRVKAVVVCRREDSRQRGGTVETAHPVLKANVRTQGYVTYPYLQHVQVRYTQTTM
jgi:hypothetical protein